MTPHRSGRLQAWLVAVAAVVLVLAALHLAVSFDRTHVVDPSKLARFQAGVGR